MSCLSPVIGTWVFSAILTHERSGAKSTEGTLRELLSMAFVDFLFIDITGEQGRAAACTVYDLKSCYGQAPRILQV